MAAATGDGWVTLPSYKSTPERRDGSQAHYLFSTFKTKELKWSLNPRGRRRLHLKNRQGHKTEVAYVGGW